MPYARYLAALLCLVMIGCSESGGPSEGMLESSFVTDGGVVPGPRDNSTDPAVTLLHADSDAAQTSGDSGAPPPIGDAGPVEAGEPVEPDEPDAAIPDSGSEPEPPVTEPDPPDDDDDDNGGLVGTVCDLLGGLLCPVGLLCVDGLCQQPTD